MSAPTWTGTWVADRLGITLSTGQSATGLDLADLVGLAVRRNPRRAHLLVSTVLGKHVPTDPDLVEGAGRLLGVLVGQALTGAPVTDTAGGDLVRDALAGDTRAATRLVEHTLDTPAPDLPDGTVVLGYAETATGLGHCVAAQLRAPVLHSTRRPVPGIDGAAGFEEEHSHATSHLLLPADPGLLTGDGPLVLVDDELSTGTTAANTIRALHAAHPRAHYVIAALIDLRSRDDRAAMDALAAELGARVDVVALTAGTVTLPADVLTDGAALAASIAPTATRPAAPGPEPTHHGGWPVGVPDGGRHGIGPEQDRLMSIAAAAVASGLQERLRTSSAVHVLGTEELMYAPLLVATTLKHLVSGPVTYSTTTRSPVLVVDDPGYAIASGITFAAHDDPADGPGPRYAYNIPAGATVVLVLDSPAVTSALTSDGGLLSQLGVIAPDVAMVTIPTHVPTPTAKD